MKTNNGSIKSVFISQEIDGGWIIEKLMSDIACELVSRGLIVRTGRPDEYNGEQVVFHSRYLYCKPVKSAPLNSVFVTHIDDKLKELEIKAEFDSFDSFVCMSPQDASVLLGFGCNDRAVLGNNLPHRGMILRPIKLAIFSDKYNDGRKNECWILEYLQKLTPDLRRGIVISILGHNWEGFCTELSKIGISYELFCYDRQLPNEYALQKEILSSMDYLLYPAFDGGAMCVYDAISEGVKLIISDVGYHIDLIDGAKLFSNKTEFELRMNEVLYEFTKREMVYKERSIGVYVDKLLIHWCSVLNAKNGRHTICDQISSKNTSHADVSIINAYRFHYKKISARRIISSVYRLIYKKFKY